MPAMSLEDLNQQIARQERELEALRQELASRRTHFTTLTRRKEKLQNELRQVDAEIAALSTAPPSSPPPAQSGGEKAGPTAKAASAPPTAPPSPKDQGNKPRMGEIILAALRASGKPMTARQLSEELQRRGFPLTGTNPVKSVESRLHEMKEKRLIQRAADQPGYVLASSAGSGKAEKPKAVPPTPSSEKKAPAKPTATAKPAASGQPGKQPSLRLVLLNVLKNSRKLLSGSELAERALASGYKSTSAKFVDTVWAMLGQMEDVEHVRGKGYRLKRA